MFSPLRQLAWIRDLQKLPNLGGFSFEEFPFSAPKIVVPILMFIPSNEWVTSKKIILDWLIPFGVFRDHPLYFL